VTPDINPGLIALVHGWILLALAIYLLAIGVSFFSIAGAKALFLVVAIAYIVPNPLDHTHHRQFQTPATEHESPLNKNEQ